MLRTASHLGPHLGTVVEPVGEAAKHLMQARGRDGPPAPSGLVRMFDQGPRSRGQLTLSPGARVIRLGLLHRHVLPARRVAAGDPAGIGTGDAPGLSGSTDIGFSRGAIMSRSFRWDRCS